MVVIARFQMVHGCHRLWCTPACSLSKSCMVVVTRLQRVNGGISLFAPISPVDRWFTFHLAFAAGTRSKPCRVGLGSANCRALISASCTPTSLRRALP